MNIKQCYITLLFVSHKSHLKTLLAFIILYPLSCLQFSPQHIVSWNELTCHVCSCQVGLAAFATYGPLLFPWVPVGPDGGTSRTSHKWNAIMAQNCLTALGLAICKPRGWHIPRSKYPNQTWTTNFCPHWHLVYIYIIYIFVFCHMYIYIYVHSCT